MFYLVKFKSLNCGLSVARFVRPVWIVVAVALACALAVPFAFAQSISPDLLRSVSPEMLRALQQGQLDGGLNADTGALKPDVQTFPPTVSRPDQSPPSRLEEIYLRRSGEFLKQFGYDVLGQPATVTINQSGAVLDKYVLGTNDELVVTLRGQENSTYRVRVSRDGTVTLPKLNPILAAGRRFGDFRSDLEAQVAQAYISTRVFVTPGDLHQMSILVSGEVRSPGARIVSGLASPLDVILLSGGIKKSGSLRNIRISGAGGSRTVDLYSVIARGGSSTLGVLRDGDTVYVPPLNSTAAVAGAVTRPAIFELPSGSSGTTAASMLKLAGGVEIGGSYRLAKISVLADGTLSLAPTTAGAVVRNGEVLVVLADHGATAGRVSVRGAVAGSGVYPLTASGTAGELFHSGSDLSFDGYSPFALILRRDPVTNAVTIVPSLCRRCDSKVLRRSAQGRRLDLCADARRGIIFGKPGHQKRQQCLQPIQRYEPQSNIWCERADTAIWSVRSNRRRSGSSARSVFSAATTSARTGAATRDRTSFEHQHRDSNWCGWRRIRPIAAERDLPRAEYISHEQCRDQPAKH